MTTETQDGAVDRAGREHGSHEAPPPAPIPAFDTSIPAIRHLSVGWRMSLLMVLNSVVFVTLAVVLWRGGMLLAQQWTELQRLSAEERQLSGIGQDVARLQSLIHRSLHVPTEEVVTEIGRRRAALLERLGGAGVTDAGASREVSLLALTTRQFFAGFDSLRELNDGIRTLYRTQVLKVAGEVSGLYGVLENAPHATGSRLWPALSQSRETFVEALVAIDAFYFSADQGGLERARQGLAGVAHSATVMHDLAGEELERAALTTLAARTDALARAIERLDADMSAQAQLLGTDIDGAQARMSEILDHLIGRGRHRQLEAQQSFDHGLTQVIVAVAVVGVIFLGISVAVGLIIVHSIQRPIRELVDVMAAVAGGNLDRRIPGTGAPDEIGAMARALAVFKDNARLKRRMELELEAQERRWRTVLENSPLGISIVTPNALQRLYVNPRGLELLGLSNLAEALVSPVESTYVDTPGLRALADQVRRDGAISGFEVERRRPDGTTWWCSMSIRLIDIDDRRAFIVWQDDITARRRGEAELRAAKERAETALADLSAAQQTLIQSEKMASLGGLVAGVAHEINTPLGISLTSASLMADESRRLSHLLTSGALRKSDLSRFLDMALESSDLMLANCQRAADLIKSFKQVAVDQTSDERRVFNLREYLDEILTSLGPRLKRAAPTVAIECPADLEIEGYPGPVAQVLTNFIMNSLIHGLEPGRRGHLSISVTCSAADEVVLSYADNGRGIAEDVLPKIFDPFFTTNRSGGGSGLGLNIVYNLVRQRLRGHISVASVADHGTTFTVRFPRVL